MAKWRINLLVEADDRADARIVAEFLNDLTWVGGCRDPENDPMFASVEILEKSVRRGRRTVKEDAA